MGSLRLRLQDPGTGRTSNGLNPCQRKRGNIPTVKRYQYDSHRQLENHLTDFIAAYSYARRLKTLRGFTPYEFICKLWTDDPSRFISNPHHQSPGPSTERSGSGERCDASRAGM